MPEGPDAVDVTVETHSLLLSLAGLVDDELLAWCRELVAVGEGDYAIELATSAVQADRVRLPAGPHEALLAAAGRRQLLAAGETLPPADQSPRMRHRFVADPATAGFPPGPTGDRDPEVALRAVPSRLLRDCQVLLVWRTTPAGGAPGPLPHPVVLIETAEAAGADVLAYQVGEVLARAGVFASVEVFAAEHQLGDYHRAALTEARRLEVVADTGTQGGGPAPRRARPPRPDLDTGTDKPQRPADGQRRGSPASAEAGSRDDTRRAPLRPVDRVITARGASSSRPASYPPDATDGASEDDQPGDRSSADRRTSDRPGNGVWKPPSQLPAPSPSQEPAGPGSSGGFPVVGNGSFPVAGTGNQPPRARQANRRSDNTNVPDPPAGLSDVEQRLLRQLHEELAAREDTDAPPEQQAPHATRIFRNTNGGRKPRGPRPMGPPPDQAG
jgi:hypothetical protein